MTSSQERTGCGEMKQTYSFLKPHRSCLVSFLFLLPSELQGEEQNTSKGVLALENPS